MNMKKGVCFPVSFVGQYIIISNQMDAYACIENNVHPVALVTLSRSLVLNNDKMMTLM